MLRHLFIILIRVLSILIRKIGKLTGVESLHKALRVRSEFLGRMGHEMRNPMNSIMGMTHLLMETPLNEQQRKYLSILQKSSTGLLDVLNNLLDFSNLEAGTVKSEEISFDLYPLLERSVDLVTYGTHQNGVELLLSLDPDVPLHLKGDPVRLQQVLSNLLGNAVKFTKKGRVILRVQKLKQFSEHKTQLEFSVIDTGIGIEKKNIHKIFYAFVQEDSSVKRRFGGTGLGLSISKDLVSLLGGTLSVESQKNIGSRFYFTLPFYIDHQKQELPQQIQLPDDRRALKILAADDSSDNQFIVQAYLNTLPYQIIFADNGRIALDHFKQTRFDIVLMDLQMPEMDGYTATQLMRDWERTRSQFPTPIVAISAHNNEATSDRFRSSQFTSYLVKPVSHELLRKTIFELAQATSLPSIEKQISEMAPQYLDLRTQDFKLMESSLIQKNYKKIHSISHKIKGNAKCYGFAPLGEYCDQIEKAIEHENSDLISHWIDQSKTYISKQIIQGSNHYSKKEIS